MEAILIQAVGLFLIILLGFFLKRVGLLSKADGTTLSVVIVNVTLPAVVIVNLAKLSMQADLVLFIIIGFVWSLVQIAIAWFASRKDSAKLQQLYMYCASGFNIGNFTLPFVQGFLPMGVPFISMFDMGNSIMLCGGTNIVVDRLVGNNTSFHPKQIALRLVRSIPFTCYLVMLCLRIVNITLPDSFLTMLQPVASANVFLSMFMIGLYLELRLPKSAVRDVVKLLSIRYGVGLAIIVAFYFLPIPHLQKVILSLLAITPIPLFGVINSVLAGVKEEVVGFASSISFLLSLPLMTLVVLILGTSV
ncbi:transporter [Enterococcus saccharolyticus]|uniref:Transporter n=1 Tax=Candidatus Enterococcus willemsii TaxID=1857215 RepID=A0ABQ6Z296_9ENTE|nr:MULTISPECIES: transporter [Enterococcus]KAF1305514.1 transporter [Enterococcus sp. CU12B]MCD5002728.1 transporter [Enterococcus saccharolyticus]